MKPTLNEEKVGCPDLDGRASIVFGRGSMYARINSRTPFVKKVPTSANRKCKWPVSKTWVISNK